MMSDRIEILVAEYIERRELGEDLDVDSFCDLHADVRDVLRRALTDLEHMEGLFPEESPLLPERIGRWVVTGRLGSGGLGMVFRARREDAPEIEAAVKILAPAAQLDRRSRTRFRREGRALERLVHPNVVRVIEFDADAPLPFLAMELVHGTTLQRRIEDSRRCVADEAPSIAGARCVELPGEGDATMRVALFTAKLCRAVASLHAAEVMHRDLKPTNIMVRPDGEPVIIDFGLAADVASTSLTHTGDRIGTPRYMAPEQARGERTSPETETWQLGAVLRECLTLEAPDSGLDRRSLLARLASEPIPALSGRTSGVPKPLATIVDKMMSFERDDRYASPAEAADDLERFTNGERIHARGPSALRRLARATRRRRSLIFAIALVFVALVIGLELSNARSKRAEARRTETIDLTRRAWTAYLDGDADATDLARRLHSLDTSNDVAAWILDRNTETPRDEWSDPTLAALARGESSRRAGDIAKALVEFERASESAPDLGVARALHGIAALGLERYDLAERELRAALRTLDGSRTLHGELARLLQRRQEHGDAAKELRRALEKDPSDAKLNYRLAVALLNSGDHDGALATARNAMSRLGEPGVQILNLYGVLLDGNGRRAEAREVFADILRRQPKRARTIFNLAVSFDAEHRMIEAAERYREAAAADPGYAVPHISLANLHSGASRDICESCRAFYREHPEALDPAIAESEAVAALSIDRGKTTPLVDLAVTIAARIRRFEKIEETIVSLHDEARTSNDEKRSARLDHALATLRTMRGR